MEDLKRGKRTTELLKKQHWVYKRKRVFCKSKKSYKTMPSMLNCVYVCMGFTKASKGEKMNKIAKQLFDVFLDLKENR